MDLKNTIEPYAKHIFLYHDANIAQPNLEGSQFSAANHIFCFGIKQALKLVQIAMHSDKGL